MKMIAYKLLKTYYLICDCFDYLEKKTKKKHKIRQHSHSHIIDIICVCFSTADLLYSKDLPFNCEAFKCIQNFMYIYIFFYQKQAIIVKKISCIKTYFKSYQSIRANVWLNVSFCFFFVLFFFCIFYFSFALECSCLIELIEW